MSNASDVLVHAPHEIRRAGGSVPLRLGLLVLAVVLNIGFYLPSVPSSAAGGIPGLDKVAHMLVFALTVWAAGRVLAPVRRFPIGWIVIIALVNAGMSELFQLVLLPKRDGSFGDLAADLIGIALGVVVWSTERRRRQNVSE